MRRPFLIGCLVLLALAPAATQTSLTGKWRAVLLLPDGGTQNLSLELDAEGGGRLRERPGFGHSRGSPRRQHVDAQRDRAEQRPDLCSPAR